MKRSGFKRKELPRPPRQWPEPIVPVPGRVARMAAINDKAFRPSPKSRPQRNRALLDMARGQPCLMRLPGCDGGGATTVAAHSNSLWHGKSLGRKADDAFSVWCCAPCHHQFDFGVASREEKEAAFERAHRLQVQHWHRIAADPLADPRGAEAARWAIDCLTPIERTQESHEPNP